MRLLHFTFICLLTINIVAQEDDEKLFSLFYEHNEYLLTENHLKLLDSLNTIENKSLYDIHIKGYASEVGNTAYNIELSNKRATLVKQKLNKFTIISSKGYGVLVGNEVSSRRVDIFIHLKENHIHEEGEIIEKPEVIPKQQNFKKKPKKGDKLILEGIMFYQDRDIIMDESKEALDELVSYLKQNEDIKFILLGHICCGDEESPHLDVKNVRTGKNNLSEARALSLYNYLLKQGIEKSRMRYKGMAFRNPTGKGADFDRRVEIEITSTY